MKMWFIFCVEIYLIVPLCLMMLLFYAMEIIDL